MPPVQSNRRGMLLMLCSSAGFAWPFRPTPLALSEDDPHAITSAGRRYITDVVARAARGFAVDFFQFQTLSHSHSHLIQDICSLTQSHHANAATHRSTYSRR